MKKLFCFLLLCTSVLIFSCRTTEETSAVQETQETESPVVTEDSVIESSQPVAETPAEDEEALPEDEETPETENALVEEYRPDIKVGWIDDEQTEKIPQEELDEMEVLLAENTEDTKIDEEQLQTAPVEEEKPAEAPPALLVVVPPTETEDVAQTDSAPEVSVAPSTTTAPTTAATQTAPVSTAPATTAATSSATTTTAPASTTQTTARPTATATTAPAATTSKTDKDIAAAYTFVDESLEDEDETPEEDLLGKEDIVIVPSREFSVKRNQYVDIVYPGTGWIYMGEENSQNHFVFEGRKLGESDTTFVLRSKKSGSTVLHFYKNDLLTGKYLDDYIEINVSEESAFDTAHVVAPSYSEFVPQKYQRPTEDELAEKEEKNKPLIQRREENKTTQESAKTESAAPATTAPATVQKQEIAPATTATSERVQTVIQTAESAEDDSGRRTEVAGAPNSVNDVIEEQPADTIENLLQGNVSAATLLEQAQKAYDEKRYPDSLNLLTRFFDIATEDLDAGLYLEGRVLEARSEVQNIKRAIEVYDTLIKNWPQSIYWTRANERSIYLKRFYIDIR